MALTATQVQGVYVAFFNRPADPIGLKYWMESATSVQQLMDSFATTSEYTSAFTGMTSAQIVNKIYNNVLGRDAEVETGLNYWGPLLEGKTLTLSTIAYNIASSSALQVATSIDRVAFESKTAAAVAFTNALDTNSEIVGYRDNGDVLTRAKAFIAGVKDKATLDSAVATSALDATVSAIVAVGNAVAGQTYSLTTGVDTVTGTAGNDTITALLGTGQTMTTLDAIDAKGGTDVMNITDIAAAGTELGGAKNTATSASISGVETINLVAAGPALIDTTTGVTVTGLTALNVTKSAGNGVVVVGDGTAVSVTNSTGTVSVTATNSALTINNTAGTATAIGGSTQTVTTAGGYVVSKATGAITVVDTAQAAVDSTVNGGTNVSVTATTSGAGKITVGGTAEPTGTVTIVQNLKGSKADLGGGAIKVSGGTVDAITVNATQATAGNTTTIGAIAVVGTSATTAVSVTQTAGVAGAVASKAATAGVTETVSTVFGALKSGDSLEIGGLVFTATKDLTGSEVAAAFANVASGGIQGVSANGAYSSTKGAGLNGWSSGAATKDTVVFTSTTANTDMGAITNTLVNTSTKSTAAVPTATDGKAAGAAVTGIAGITNNTVTITDVNNASATKAGTITQVTAANFTQLDVNSNALTTLSVTGGAGNINIGNGGLTTATNKTLALTIDGQTSGWLDDADVYTTLNITTTGANSKLANITDTALTALSVAGTKTLTLTTAAGMSALKTVTVSGSAGLSADVSALTKVTSVDTSQTTGASTITLDATAASFAGGAGVDTVTASKANPTNTISLGAGDDSLTLAAGTSAPTKAITGGDGTDTLTLNVADADAADASGTFATLVTGFEKLALTGAASTVTVDAAVLGNYNYVTTSNNTSLTVNGMTSGATLAVNAANTAAVVGIASASTGKADVLNVVVTGKAAVAAGSVTAADVETVNITSTGGSAAHSMTLVATSATSLVVSGGAPLTLTNIGNVAAVSINASAMTAGLTTTAFGSKATTITGGSGADVLTASTGTLADTLIGGDGNDTLTSNAGATTLTGGAGADKFVIGTVSANVNTYTTITDAAAGDMIQLLNLGVEKFTATKVTLAATAVFQDYANAVIAASAANNSTAGAIGWFQFGGDTYIVESRHDNTANALPSFQNNLDLVVKLTGLVDLSAASLNTDDPATLLIGTP